MPMAKFRKIKKFLKDFPFAEGGKFGNIKNSLKGLPFAEGGIFRKIKYSLKDLHIGYIIVHISLSIYIQLYILKDI